MRTNSHGDVKSMEDDRKTHKTNNKTCLFKKVGQVLM